MPLLSQVPFGVLDRVVYEHKGKSLYSLEIYILGSGYRTKNEVNVYYVRWLAVES